jgi:hypothetical protein
MILPANVIPILEATVNSPVLPRGLPLEIWKAEDHRAWVAAFMELGIGLFNSDIPEEDLPRGFPLVAHLFDWEAQCQAEGWHAFGNRVSTIDAVIDAYKAVGLPQEAEALRCAFAAWCASSGDANATSAAYDALKHEYSGDVDRLEYLVCHFVDNAHSLFYVANDT